MKAQVETDCVHVEKKVFFFPLKKKIAVFFFLAGVETATPSQEPWSWGGVQEGKLRTNACNAEWKEFNGSLVACC